MSQKTTSNGCVVQQRQCLRRSHRPCGPARSAGRCAAGRQAPRAPGPRRRPRGSAPPAAPGPCAEATPSGRRAQRFAVGSACTPGANFGTRKLTRVPARRSGLDDQAVRVAVDLAQPRVDVGQPDRPAPRAGAPRVFERGADDARIRAGPVVLDGDHRVRAVVDRADRDRHDGARRPPGRAARRSRPAAARRGTAPRSAAPPARRAARCAGGPRSGPARERGNARCCAARRTASRTPRRGAARTG